MMPAVVLWMVGQTIELPGWAESLGVAGGVLAFLFVSGLVVAASVANDWKTLYQEERASREAQTQYLIGEVVPLLAEAVRVLGLRANQQGRDG